MLLFRYKLKTRILTIIIFSSLFLLLSAFSILNNLSYSIVDIQPKNIPLTEDTEQLKGFFKALSNSKNQVVRIAHYGDSSLLGDVISEYLRYEFQQQFGGEGAGFLSVCASDVTMRESSLHEFSDDWNYTSLFLRNPDGLPYGISGYVASPSEGSWVKFQTRRFIRNLREYRTADLYYNNAGPNSKVECVIDEKVTKLITLNPGSTIQKLRLFDQTAEKVELSFKSSGESYVYGVSFEKGNGVYLDNFPITGNTGVNLLDISDSMLKEFKKHLDYNLILLHYGMNLPTPKGGTLKIYKNKMLQVIKKYKEAFPEAGIIMISISDRIIRKGSRIVTSRETKPIIETQKEIAQEGGVAFWNLFEAMGGKDSMEKWVDSAPPLALKDYRHFTHAGGEIVAKLFFEAILEVYRNK